tara:strand:+ start:672 stop:1316 length:645 start_codon:yes stop_codon:yes gene_type:complete
MDIQSIRKIIFPAVSDAIFKLEEESHEVKLTMLREIFNEAINHALNISHTNNTSIKAMFAGRGRAWGKVNVDPNNAAWLCIRNTLDHEMLSSELGSKIFEECSNMIDLFESTGFAWIRFISSSKGFSKFQIRTKGSKLESHIKVRIDNIHIVNGNIQNLEGVPHKLNLECGNFFINKINKKEKIDIVINPEELDCFGIQTLENILGEELENESC